MSEIPEHLSSAIIEIRDLLRILAEPAIAERDQKSRDVLRTLAGSSKGAKPKAILLMDGTRTQAQIVSECGIHKGQLSELVKALREAGLLKGDPKQPKLSVTIPETFFDVGGDA
jgi:DNA-binding transcriptional ArsR family regulator